MLEFYNSARIIVKDIPGNNFRIMTNFIIDFIKQDSTDAKIQYVKNVLQFKNVQEKYFLTFPSFVESLVRVLHAKYRVTLKDNEYLSVLLARFFRSNNYQDAKLHVSLCYKYKESLPSKDF